MKKSMIMKLTAGILAAAMLFTSIPMDALTAPVYAAETETRAALQVQFEQEYAAVGKELTAVVTGADNAAYEWYVGDTKISNTTGTYTPTVNDLEKMIRVVAKSGSNTGEASMYFSRLPVVYIDTNGQAIISKEDYIDATMEIQGNEEYNSKTSTLYSGAIEIRGRGNTTWGMPKKPYKLKLDKKTDVFGMGKNKHWVLLANYSDESLMRNTLAYDFSGSLGMEQMSTVWTSVVMNGEYVGNYQFCEQVRVDDTRVDVFDWEGFAEDAAAEIAEAEGFNDDQTGDLETYMLEQNMGWITSGEVRFNNKTYYIKDYPKIEVPSINGGYVLELDEYYDEVSKFRTNSNQPIMFKNPEFVYTNNDMMNFVKTYVQAFEDAVRSSEYTSTYEGKTTHYSELYDFDALVDYWLISEIFFNEELNKKSTYMYKEIDELMKMGPIWDMDYSSGGEGQTYQTEQWATKYFNANAQASNWYKYLVKDPYFLMKAQERYWEIRYRETADMIASIETHREYLKESGVADYAYWLQKAGRKTSFEQEVNTLSNWFDNHITWMDGQMATEDSLSGVFYSKNDNLQLSLTDSDGNALKEEIALKAPADAVVEPGKNLKLSVTGTNSGKEAKVYVNSKFFGNVTVGNTINIPLYALTEDVGTKNVIEVKAPNTFGNTMISNYITVKQKSTGSDTGAQKSALETLVYEAAEKQRADYTTDSWSVFEKALNNSYAVLLDTDAQQSEIDNAEKELKAAMSTLIKQKNPASDTDDYDVSKIKYSAGSSQEGEGIELAFDGNQDTVWHTQYSPRPDWYGTPAAFEHFWVLFEMEESAVLDAVRYLPRNNNGDILSYRVEGSLDGDTWEDLTTGNWDRTGVEWKVAEFTPTELKYVRLWATATTSSSGENRHVSARELRLRTGELLPEPTPTPTPMPTPIPTPTPEPVKSTVFLNEIESKDADGGADWVEIFNAGEEAVDISGWFVTDDHGLDCLTDAGNLTTPLAEGTVLAAGEVLVFEGDVDFLFGIGGGDTITLYNADQQVMDTYTYADHANGTFARVPDGTGEFVDQAPTKGARNVAVSVDKEELQTAVDATAAVGEKSKYTEETWKVYEDALAAARALLTDEGATQEAVDVAAKALTAAQAALKEVTPEPIPTPTPTPTPTPIELPYEDVAETDWFYDAVAYTYVEGLMTGMDPTHFGPYGQLSRAQFALMLYRMEGETPVETEKSFEDIAGDEWYGPAVLWAAENGIVSGYQDGNFGPVDMITREQMAVMMYRYAKYLKQDVTTDASFDDFIDAASVSEFAVDAMKWAVGNGIITGKEGGTVLDPQGNTARSEAAIIIQRFMEK